MTKMTQEMDLQEEREIVRRAAEHKDQVALSRLLVKYHPLFMRIAHDRRYRILGEEVQELAQIFFLEAVNTFDTEREVPFAAYLKRLVEGRLRDFVKGALKRERQEMQTDGLVAAAPEGEGERPSLWDAAFLHGGGNVASPSAEIGGLGEHMDSYESVDFHDSMFRALEALSDRERQVVEGIFLKDKPAREVALSLGLSQSRVSHIKESALTKLRHMMGEMAG